MHFVSFFFFFFFFFSPNLVRTIQVFPHRVINFFVYLARIPNRGWDPMDIFFHFAILIKTTLCLDDQYGKKITTSREFIASSYSFSITVRNELGSHLFHVEMTWPLERLDIYFLEANVSYVSMTLTIDYLSFHFFF